MSLKHISSHSISSRKLENILDSRLPKYTSISFIVFVCVCMFVVKYRKSHERGGSGKREGVYCKKLRLMKHYLKQKGDVAMGEVAMELGEL